MQSIDQFKTCILYGLRKVCYVWVFKNKILFMRLNNETDFHETE
jgi:hypothetical protein